MDGGADLLVHQHGLLCTAEYRTVQYSTVQYSTVQCSTVQYRTVQYSTVKYSIVGNNKVSGQLENFFRWNPSGTFRNIPWHHWNNPKKVPGAPSQGFLNFLVFVENITKLKNWLSRPHFWADFQVSYHFGKLLTVRLQWFTASRILSLYQ